MINRQMCEIFKQTLKYKQNSVGIVNGWLVITVEDRFKEKETTK